MGGWSNISGIVKFFDYPAATESPGTPVNTVPERKDLVASYGPKFSGPLTKYEDLCLPPHYSDSFSFLLFYRLEGVTDLFWSILVFDFSRYAAVISIASRM